MSSRHWGLAVNKTSKFSVFKQPMLWQKMVNAGKRNSTEKKNNIVGNKWNQGNLTKGGGPKKDFRGEQRGKSCSEQRGLNI